MAKGKLKKGRAIPGQRGVGRIKQKERIVIPRRVFV